MALLSLGSVVKLSIRMPIIVDIWVFVSMISCMISFMLGQVEHETRIFCLIGCVLCAVLWEASSCALLLVSALIGYADWSHTFSSCNLGRNVSD